jgi:hypothetical protein
MTSTSRIVLVLLLELVLDPFVSQAQSAIMGIT